MNEGDTNGVRELRVTVGVGDSSYDATSGGLYRGTYRRMADSGPEAEQALAGRMRYRQFVGSVTEKLESAGLADRVVLSGQAGDVAILRILPGAAEPGAEELRAAMPGQRFQIRR